MNNMIRFGRSRVMRLFTSPYVRLQSQHFCTKKVTTTPKQDRDGNKNNDINYPTMTNIESLIDDNDLRSKIISSNVPAELEGAMMELLRNFANELMFKFYASDLHNRIISLANEVTLLKTQNKILNDEINVLNGKILRLEDKNDILNKRCNIQEALILSTYYIYDKTQLSLLLREASKTLNYMAAVYFSCVSGKLVWGDTAPEFYVSYLFAAADGAEYPVPSEWKTIMMECEKNNKPQEWKKYINIGDRHGHSFELQLSDKEVIVGGLEGMEQGFRAYIDNTQLNTASKMIEQFNLFLTKKEDLIQMLNMIEKMNQELELSDSQIAGLTDASTRKKDRNFLKKMKEEGNLNPKNINLPKLNFGVSDKQSTPTE